MGYRLPEERPHQMCATANESMIVVDNGSITRISIPCYYRYIEDSYDDRWHREQHDHFGWPSPDSPDDSCQIVSTREYAQTLVINEIDLSGEGYTGVEVCMTEPPEGLSIQSVIDGNVIRLTIYASCPDAETEDIKARFSIYAVGSCSEYGNEDEALLRDVVTKGMLRIKAGSINNIESEG